jgi:FlaA1/EpsC-like NDP-sugar epimerase
MGKPIRILDLAKAAVMLSGIRPFSDIDIVFTGVRAGEKLYEELELTEEQMSRTRHPKIFIGKINAYPEDKMRRALQRLAILCESSSDLELRRFLNELLPEAQLTIPDTVSEPMPEVVPVATLQMAN